MSKDVLIHAGIAEIRIALVKDGVLEQFWQESTLGDGEGAEGARAGGPIHIWDIVSGRVQRVLSAMEAAFVDIGLERAGFLAAREARLRGPKNGSETEEAPPQMREHVREGEALLVQVLKEPIGNKGAR